MCIGDLSVNIFGCKHISWSKIGVSKSEIDKHSGQSIDSSSNECYESDDDLIVNMDSSSNRSVDRAKLMNGVYKRRTSQQVKNEESENVQNSLEFNHKNDEIALTGKAFEHLVSLRNNESPDSIHDRENLKFILRNAKVFARMSPEGKALLVTELQKETGEMIAM